MAAPDLPSARAALARALTVAQPAPTDTLPATLFWVPFPIPAGLQVPPALAPLRTARLARGDFPSNTGPPPSGATLTDPGQAPLLPFWVFEGSPGDFALLDARTGTLVAANLPLEETTARFELITTLLITLAVSAGAIGVLQWLMVLMVGVVRPFASPRVAWLMPLGASAGTALVAAVLFRRLWALSEHGFDELLQRAATARLTAPVRGNARALLEVVPRFLALSWFATLTTLFLQPPPLPGLIAFALATLVWVAAGRETQRLARAQPCEGPTSPPPLDEWAGLVSVGVRSVRWVFLVYALADLTYTSGLFRELYASVDRTLPGPSDLVDALAQLVIVGAVARSKAELGTARWPAIAAMVSGTVAGLFFGTAADLAFSFVAIVLTLLRTSGQTLREALLAGCRYELFAALGRLAGRTIATLFLGLTFLSAGAALAEELAGLWSLQRETFHHDEASAAAPTAPTAPTPTRSPRTRWEIAAALALVALLAWAKYGAPHLKVDERWTRQSLAGWSAAFPSTPLERHCDVNLADPVLIKEPRLHLDQLRTEAPQQQHFMLGRLAFPDGATEERFRVTADYLKRVHQADRLQGEGEDFIIGLGPRGVVLCGSALEASTQGARATLLLACVDGVEGADATDALRFLASVKRDDDQPLLPQRTLESLRDNLVPMLLKSYQTVPRPDALETARLERLFVTCVPPAEG